MLFCTYIGNEFKTSARVIIVVVLVLAGPAPSAVSSLTLPPTDCESRPSFSIPRVFWHPPRCPHPPSLSLFVPHPPYPHPCLLTRCGISGCAYSAISTVIITAGQYTGIIFLQGPVQAENVWPSNRTILLLWCDGILHSCLHFCSFGGGNVTVRMRSYQTRTHGHGRLPFVRHGKTVHTKLSQTRQLT